MVTKRVMCVAFFTDGEEAKAAGDKLRTAGFELMISNHPEDFDDCSDMKFGMIWKDYTENMDARQAMRDFETTVHAVCPFCTDETGFVQPEHVPTRYADFGKCSAALGKLNSETFASI
jgi:hypothetical protein